MNGRWRVILALLVVAVSLLSMSARAEDRREVRARTLFAKGKYQPAMDLYAELFAEKGDPIYLRNIGRCNQMLQQPDEAIHSFREYLRRGHVKAQEQGEIEGFIKEMEALQRERAAATPPPTAPSTSPEPVRPLAAPQPASPQPAAPQPAAPPAPLPSVEPASSAPGATLTQVASPVEEPSAPITHRWWFWTGIGVLLAGGAASAFVLTRPHSGGMPACTASECL